MDSTAVGLQFDSTVCCREMFGSQAVWAMPLLRAGLYGAIWVEVHVFDGLGAHAGCLGFSEDRRLLHISMVVQGWLDGAWGRVSPAPH